MSAYEKRTWHISQISPPSSQFIEEWERQVESAKKGYYDGLRIVPVQVYVTRCHGCGLYMIEDSTRNFGGSSNMCDECQEENLEFTRPYTKGQFIEMPSAVRIKRDEHFEQKRTRNGITLDDIYKTYPKQNSKNPGFFQRLFGG